MKYQRIIIAFFTLNFSGHCLAPLKTLLKPDRELPFPNSAAAVIQNNYQQLAQNTNDAIGVLNLFSTNLIRFTESLLEPPNGSLDILQTRLELIYNHLQASIKGLPDDDPFKISLGDAKKLVVRRIKKTKIDIEMTKEGDNAVVQDFNFPDIPPAVQEALEILTGSIFHIVQKEDGSERVRRVGSAMALPTMPNNRFLNGRPLTRVLTCAHVIKAKEDTKIQVYFVPNRALHACGWPMPNLLAINVDNDDTPMINFLRSNPDSFHLISFTINRNDGSNQEFQENEQPQYFKKEDIVMCYIYLRDKQFPLIYEGNHRININFISTISSVRNHLRTMRQQNRPYFAIGHPGMHHHEVEYYMKSNEPALYQNWVRNKGIAPIITSKAIARNQPKQYPRLQQSTSLILHETLTSKGMSGGPLITINSNNSSPVIEIFGVIRAGKISDNSAVLWR